jgi:hypothetical protein
LERRVTVSKAIPSATKAATMVRESRPAVSWTKTVPGGRRPELPGEAAELAGQRLDRRRVGRERDDRGRMPLDAVRGQVQPLVAQQATDAEMPRPRRRQVVHAPMVPERLREVDRLGIAAERPRHEARRRARHQGAVRPAVEERHQRARVVAEMRPVEEREAAGSAVDLAQPEHGPALRRRQIGEIEILLPGQDPAVLERAAPPVGPKRKLRARSGTAF